MARTEKTRGWTMGLSATRCRSRCKTSSSGFRAILDAPGADPTRNVGVFSCSKATNEVNYLVGKFARGVFGTNNVDSCNRT